MTTSSSDKRRIEQAKDEILLLLNDENIQCAIVKDILYGIIPMNLQFDVYNTRFGVVLDGKGTTVLDCVISVDVYLTEAAIAKVKEYGSTKEIRYNHSKAGRYVYTNQVSDQIAFYLNERLASKTSYSYVQNMSTVHPQADVTNDSLARSLGCPRYIVCEIVPYLSEYSNTLKRINMHIAKMKKDYTSNKDAHFFPVILTFGQDPNYHNDKIKYEQMRRMLYDNDIDVMEVDKLKKLSESLKFNVTYGRVICDYNGYKPKGDEN